MSAAQGDRQMEAGPDMSGNRRRIVAIALVLAAALGLFFAGKTLGWWGKAAAVELTLYGNVEIREVQLGFRVGGRLAALLVDEGDRVAAGQLLARLDIRPLQNRLASAEARLAAASAGVARDAAGNRPQQISEAQASLTSANAALGEARRLQDRRRALFERGFMSRADYQSSQFGFDAAVARVDAARAGLSLAREGTRLEDRTITRANRDALLAERQAVTTDIADAQLHSPEAGQILTRAKEAGAIVQPGETVLGLALTQPVRVRAYVAEPDLPRVRPGMAVHVLADGTNKRWAARVGFISPVAEFTPKTVQTERLRADLVYRLRLVVDDPYGDLRQGQPVTVVVPLSGQGG